MQQSRHVTLKKTNTPCTGDETYREKNLRLKRPLSPYITIYKMQMQSYMSVIHRITGMIISGCVAVLGIGSLTYCSYTDDVLKMLDEYPLFMTLLKVLVAAPFSYHYINGFRHLMWDSGRIYTMKQVFQTGYVVIALTAVLTSILIMLISEPESKEKCG